MRKIFKISTLCFLIITMGALTSADAQSYLSKPQGMLNLIEENNHITASLPQWENSDPDAFALGLEKQKVIQRMLRDLKKGSTLSEVAEYHLPKEDNHQIQLGISIKAPDSEKNRLAWFRDEILRLITY